MCGTSLDVRRSNRRVILQSIIIKKSHKNDLKDHTEKYGQNESCALLFGKTDGEETTVKEIFLADNVEKSKVNFTISNEELLEAYKESEEKGLDVVGIFHSHPSSEAYPSATDKKFMKINPVIWLIFSGLNDEFRGFALNKDDRVTEVKIIEE